MPREQRAIYTEGTMLVISRKAGETILIGDVTVKILSTQPSRVKVGIEADRDVRVVRGELEKEEEKP